MDHPSPQGSKVVSMMKTKEEMSSVKWAPRNGSSGQLALDSVRPCQHGCQLSILTFAASKVPCWSFRCPDSLLVPLWLSACECVHGWRRCRGQAERNVRTPSLDGIQKKRVPKVDQQNGTGCLPRLALLALSLAKRNWRVGKG